MLCCQQGLCQKSVLTHNWLSDSLSLFTLRTQVQCVRDRGMGLGQSILGLLTVLCTVLVWCKALVYAHTLEPDGGHQGHQSGARPVHAPEWYMVLVHTLEPEVWRHQGHRCGARPVYSGSVGTRVVQLVHTLEPKLWWPQGHWCGAWCWHTVLGHTLEP